MKLKARIILIAIFCYCTAALSEKEKCKLCVPVDECHLFKEMSAADQKNMLNKFPCKSDRENSNTPFGFASVAKGDYICCPDTNVWGIEKSQNKDNYREQPLNNDQSNQHIDTENHQLNDDFNNEDSQNGNYKQNSDDGAYEPNSWPRRKRPNNKRKNVRSPPYQVQPNLPNNPRYTMPNNNQNGFPNFNGATGNVPGYDNQNGNFPNFNGATGKVPGYDNQNGNFPNFNGAAGNVPGYDNQNGNFPSFNGATGNVPGYDNQNGNFPNYNGVAGNVPDYNNQNYPNSNNPNGNIPYNNGNQGNFNENRNGLGPNLANQCTRVTSFPPAPESGCCGIEVPANQRIQGPNNGYIPQIAQNPNNYWGSQPAYPRRTGNSGRFTRQAQNEKINITLDNRIIGGKETELEQFPWTVLLKTTFDYVNRRAAFNCGGSLISSRYVLTAAHCVTEEGANVASVQVNLAEYDKRSFPRDCVNVPGVGQKCIDNIVMEAEEIVPHPEYDDTKLQNDIALIRLRGSAPYTDFIRPICLPPIDIDDPRYSDLRLAVAGWGRNGEYTSQVKQSTVVNLVPQRECSRSYSELTRKHLCAAGHSGEDTCKGDSGGPLMMLYKGQYFVSGVVSGKRSDSPCGTSLPSLYTNVYQYIEWILQNIRN